MQDGGNTTLSHPKSLVIPSVMSPTKIIAGDDEDEDRMNLERDRITKNLVRSSSPESLESELNERRKKRSAQRETRRSTRMKYFTSSSQVRAQQSVVRSESSQEPIHNEQISQTETEVSTLRFLNTRS